MNHIELTRNPKARSKVAAKEEIVETRGNIANQHESFLNSLARTKLRIRKPWPAFQVCGYTGVLAAIAMTMLLAVKVGLSTWVMGLIIVSAMATFLTLAMTTEIITGEEQLIYYQQEIAVMLVSALVVKVLRQPVLPYLDLMILGIGTFLAFGRVGCLMVGCCHGRPFRWGIRYRSEHAEEGFAPYLVGVTLFPIQALESVWVFFVVVVGVIFMWKGQPPGSALAWYSIAYGAARFNLEFIRGDIERPYTLGFSQGQWLSLWLMSALIWTEWTGRMPFHAWHSLTVAGLVCIMVVAAVHRKLDRGQRFRIFHPYHVREVAAVLSDPKPQAASIGVLADGKSSRLRVECTSLGFQISQAKIHDARAVDYYTLSSRNCSIAQPAATLLADLILSLRGPKNETFVARLVPGQFNAFHLMISREHQKEAGI